MSKAALRGAALLLALLAAVAPCSLALLQPGGAAHDASLALDRHRSPVQRGCVLLRDGAPAFVAAAAATAACQGAAASGSFLPGRRTVGGWGQLSISTSAAYSDAEQALALGYLEGWMTAVEIRAHHHNMKAHFNLSSDAPLEWLQEQDDWTRQQAAVNGSAFWAALGLLHAQMDGMQAGYNARAQHERRLAAGRAGGTSFGGAESDGTYRTGSADGSPLARLPPLSRRDFLFMSAVGDLDPLVEGLSAADGGAAAAEARWAQLSPHQLAAELHTAGRCSAVVKVTPDFSNLLMGHSAWFTFGAMVRIYKHYAFALHHPSLRLKRMSFSSYPGELSSDNDFYMLSTGLVVLQTTNSVYNKTLLRSLTPQSVLSWQRVRAASFLARDGQAWTDVIAQHNSGTGDNQWMVVDLKLFRPGHELQRGLLWVVEQMPGLVVASDQTGTLERGYWPSYNIPFHPEVYARSGYPAFIQGQAARGSGYAAAAVAGASYQLAPRAQIFRRDAPGVDTLPALKALLRSNKWPDEPFAGGSPLGALCGRGDWDPSSPRLYGCYDTKVTTWSLAQRLEADAVVGPTYGPGAPPFAWSRAGALAEAVAHIGQPDEFAYDFERMTGDAKRWRGAPPDAA